MNKALILLLAIIGLFVFIINPLTKDGEKADDTNTKKTSKK